MKRPLIILIITTLLLASLSAQTPRQLLVINAQTGEPYDSAMQSCISELQRLGYSEAAGTLSLRQYSLGNSTDFMKRIQTLETARLSSYDAIILNGTIALMAVKDIWSGLRDVNFLFLNITDPVGIGVIDGFDMPASTNFSGISYPVPVRQRLRFIRKVLPSVRRIGYIYADMPQSWSYTEWLTAVLAEPEFRNLELVSRKIDFVAGENGGLRMAINAGEVAAEINDEVDVFLAPNDQLGVNLEYSQRLARVVNKPIIALGYQEVIDRAGALMSVYPDTVKVGQRLALMLLRLFNGEKLSAIYPEQAPYDYIIDRIQAQRFGIRIPPEYSAKVR